MSLQAKSLTQVIERLKALDGKDSGNDHSEADDLLCDALLLLQGHEVVTAYKEAQTRVGFWYA